VKTISDVSGRSIKYGGVDVSEGDFLRNFSDSREVWIMDRPGRRGGRI
jgi:hypothetical protein